MVAKCGQNRHALRCVFDHCISTFCTCNTIFSGIYRKSHIPDGVGYQEKYYFNGGDTGFKVFKTRYANIGVGICWDQWFPECARAMTLGGAELLLYPTAIGSGTSLHLCKYRCNPFILLGKRRSCIVLFHFVRPEPLDPSLNSSKHWQRVMQGHSGANILPVIASNRIGVEKDMVRMWYYLLIILH